MAIKIFGEDSSSVTLDGSNVSEYNDFGIPGLRYVSASDIVDDTPYSAEEQTASDNNSEPELLVVKSANDWIFEAAARKDPRPLWLSLWHENEICCLFADSNLGKSIYAVQIASEIAKTEPVLYCDFELSDKQFQMRYTDPETSLIHTFPDNFMRAEINMDALCGYSEDIEGDLIRKIERVASEYQIKKIIIDNLSFLCNASDKSDIAGRFMMRLLELKRCNHLSILVLAHTPKRSLNSPITQNDLAGSKRLFNFFDSAFAIGRSARDGNLRYIKQLKSRAGAFEYDADNVIVAEIDKMTGWLYFRTVGYAPEREHLKENNTEDFETDSRVEDLRRQGKSIREIATTLGLSKSRVGRICCKTNL